MAVEVMGLIFRGARVAAARMGNRSLRLRPEFAQLHHVKLFRLTDQAAQATLSVSDCRL